MKKKKIFILIHQGILKGGVEKVFYNLLNNLPMAKYDITVLSIMGYLKDDFETQLYPPQVKRYCLMWDELSKQNTLKRIKQKIHNRLFPLWIKLQLKFLKYDVAIAAQEGMYADYILKNVRAKKKLLWIHNDISQCHWSLKHYGSLDVERHCYEKFDKVICVSKMVANSMTVTFGPMHNLAVCYNPIDTAEIDEKLKAKLPERPSSNPWFVCVGRLCHQKAYDRLIEVCRRLNLEGYKYDVSILGDGEDREVLENMLTEFGMDNVHLLGCTDNPFIYMKSADWLLLPSRHEGFSMVLQEAAYCNTPIISTDVSGARELLGDSEYGLIMDNSTESIYKMLKNVLDDSNLHSKYSEAISQRRKFVNLEFRIKIIQEIIDN